jgi:hypothetical protein
MLFGLALVLWYAVGYVLFINEMRHEFDVTHKDLLIGLLFALFGPLMLIITIIRFFGGLLAKIPDDIVLKQYDKN